MLETWDGTVVKATPSFRWSIEKDIGAVLDWVVSHDGRWKLAPMDATSPSLDSLPVDRDIAKRTSP